MIRLIVPVLAALLGLAVPSPVGATPPRVAADIPPVHALVARVMQGLGRPALILPPGASPHGYALRPSEARTLARADLVVWVGPRLTPWLADPVATLAAGAERLTLMELGSMRLRRVRGLAHGHGHRHDGGGHGSSAGEEGHGGHEEGPKYEEHEAHEAQANGPIPADATADPSQADPHVWLDPDNARAAVSAIAETLGRLDPANAPLYRRNADAASAEIAAAAEAARARLAPVSERPYVVLHDAYGYFEDRFGLDHAAAIRGVDAAGVGAARLAAVRETIAGTGAVCVFAEAPYPDRMAGAVAEATGARTGVLDPLGVRIEPGPAFYPALISALAADIADCLSGAR